MNTQTYTAQYVATDVVTNHVPDVGYRAVAWLHTGEAVEYYAATEELAIAGVRAKRDAVNTGNMVITDAQPEDAYDGTARAVFTDLRDECDTVTYAAAAVADNWEDALMESSGEQITCAACGNSGNVPDYLTNHTCVDDNTLHGPTCGACGDDNTWCTAPGAHHTITGDNDGDNASAHIIRTDYRGRYAGLHAAPGKRTHRNVTAPNTPDIVHTANPSGVPFRGNRKRGIPNAVTQRRACDLAATTGQAITMTTGDHFTPQHSRRWWKVEPAAHTRHVESDTGWAIIAGEPTGNGWHHTYMHCQTWRAVLAHIGYHYGRD